MQNIVNHLINNGYNPITKGSRSIFVTINGYNIYLELESKSNCLFMMEDDNFDDAGKIDGLLDKNFDSFWQGGPNTYYIENISQNYDKFQQFIDIVKEH